MRWWRIAHQIYALDRQCAGAAMNGGRWNPIGLSALYCSDSIALCSLEKLAHQGVAPLPPLVLVAVDIPDSAALYHPDLAALPADWNSAPSVASTQYFGSDWLQNGTELAMIVPSILIPEESNLVLNPRHSDYLQVTLQIKRAFTFDTRLISTS